MNEFKEESDKLLQFGRSLWSAISCQRNWSTRVPSETGRRDWILKIFENLYFRLQVTTFTRVSNPCHIWRTENRNPIENGIVTLLYLLYQPLPSRPLDFDPLKQGPGHKHALLSLSLSLARTSREDVKAKITRHKVRDPAGQSVARRRIWHV